MHSESPDSIVSCNRDRFDHSPKFSHEQGGKYRIAGGVHVEAVWDLGQIEEFTERALPIGSARDSGDRVGSPHANLSRRPTVVGSERQVKGFERLSPVVFGRAGKV